MDITVVVCAYDERRWGQIQAALRSVKTQTIPAKEIVVVVDHNEPLRQRLGLETDAKVVPNAYLPGLAGTRNSGVEAASGTVVAFLDDDAVACSQWLELLREAYQDERVAAVGGSAEPLWHTARPAWFPPEFDWVIGCSYLGMPEQAQEVRNLFGCNMSYRRALIEEVGGFRIGYSCDETELCIRIGQRWPEMKILYLPQAKIAHNVPDDRTRFRRFLTRCYFEGGSKRVVAALVGRSHGLATELDYTRKVLPRGVAHGLGDTLRRRDPAGAARAAAIVAGLTSTAAGYLAASLFTARAARRRGWTGDLPV